jgi:hypothetical protein
LRRILAQVPCGFSHEEHRLDAFQGQLIDFFHEGEDAF